MAYTADKLFGKKRRRIWELDFLRGLALVLMIFDHLCFDLSELPAYYSGEHFPPLSSLDWGAKGIFFIYYAASVIIESKFRLMLHYIFVTVFLLLTGISCTLSRSNLMRFFKLAAFATIITCATTFLDSVGDFGSQIIFGILHLMATSVLLYIIIDGAVALLNLAINKILEKIDQRKGDCAPLPPPECAESPDTPPVKMLDGYTPANRTPAPPVRRKIKLKSDLVLLLAGAAIIIAGICIKWYNAEYVSFYGARMTAGDLWRVAMGFIVTGSDHFGILPCAGVVLAGAYIGRQIYAAKRSLLPRLDGSWNRLYCFIGRHTAWIYVLHQPVLIGLIMLIGMLCGVKVM